MAYRYLTRQDAWHLYKARADNAPEDVESFEKVHGDGAVLEVDSLVEDCSNFVKSLSDATTVPAHAYEGNIGRFLHEHLRGQEAIDDPRFWLWLSLGHLAEIVVDRSTRFNVEYTQRLVGLGPTKEGFLYRSFLRADLGYDENAPSLDERYRHALVGDQDFWVSHVIRLSFAARKDILHSIVRFQYPGLKDDPLLAPGTHPLGMRLLAKRIRRVSSTTSLVFVDATEWEGIVEELASRQELETIPVVKRDGKPDSARIRMLETLISDGKVKLLRKLPSDQNPREYQVMTACLRADGTPYQKGSAGP